jgi:hypothetical protein
VTIWIPGHVPSPNRTWRLPLRRRMATIKAMREKAQLLGLKARVEAERAYRRELPPITRAHVLVECHRARLVNEHDNLKSSVKHYIDGLTSCQHKPRCPLGTCPKLVLPMGDDGGHYTFDITQKLVRRREEGVLVTILPNVSV